MTGLIRTFIFMAALAGGVGFILYHLFKFYTSISGKKSQISKDVGALREEIDDYLEKLVPLDDEEIKLLSLNQIDKQSSKTRHRITKGVFTSIYQEPLLAYAYKEYADTDYRVLVAQTYNDEYLYISKGNRTDVYLNDDAIGYMKGSDKLYELGEGKSDLLASIEADHALSSHPINIGNRLVGEVSNPSTAHGHTPRAFQGLEPMSNEERPIFLALSFLSLVTDTSYQA